MKSSLRTGTILIIIMVLNVKLIEAVPPADTFPISEVKQAEAIDLPQGHYDPACVYDMIIKHFFTPANQNELASGARSVAAQLYKRFSAMLGVTSETVEYFLKQVDPYDVNVQPFKSDIAVECQIPEGYLTVRSDPRTGTTSPIIDPDVERISEILSELFAFGRLH